MQTLLQGAAAGNWSAAAVIIGVAFAIACGVWAFCWAMVRVSQ